MTKRAKRERGDWYWPSVAVALVTSCSLQNFDYLRDAADDSQPEAGSDSGGSSGEAGSDTGGSGPMGGGAGEGGTRGGTSGSSNGGTSGSNSGGTDGATGGTGMGGTAGMAGGEGGDGGTGNTGATGTIVNPSFETSNTAGWTVDPASALTSRYIYVQFPTGTIPAPDGSYELSTWHQTDDYVVEIFQNVTGLEDGTYTLTAQFSRGDGHNEIYLFARNCGGAEPEPVPIPVASTAFQPVSLSGIEVIGGSCEIGVHVDATYGDWMNADMFRLEPEPE